jgi:hypothetical protein
MYRIIDCISKVPYPEPFDTLEEALNVLMYVEEVYHMNKLPCDLAIEGPIVEEKSNAS